jgi:hypothetical protein
MTSILLSRPSKSALKHVSAISEATSRIRSSKAEFHYGIERVGLLTKAGTGYSAVTSSCPER